MKDLVRKSGGLMVFRGVIALLFGLFALFNPEGASGLFITLFALYLLIDGLLNIVIALSNRDTAQWGMYLTIGVLEIVVAIVTFLRPDITGAVLAILIGLWLLLKGTIEVFLGIDLRRELDGEWMLILSGVLAVVAGIAFILLPFSDSVAAIWLFGLYAVVYGTLYIVEGAFVRKHAGEFAEAIEKAAQEADTAS